MNVHYNSALRQSNAIKADLSKLSESPATSSSALKGQLNASLTSFSRTIDEYNKLAKQEIIPDKQEKAFSRVKNFRAELSDFREQFDLLKKQSEEAQSSQNRTELLGRRPHHAATPENPYANATATADNPYAKQGSVFQPSNPNAASPFGASPADYNRETHALREQSFMTQANSQIDAFLDQGRAVLNDLGSQRDVLKGTQRKLYSVANTLGVSQDTIRMVERRAMQDKWIFWSCVVVFFVFCYLVLRFLR